MFTRKVLILFSAALFVVTALITSNLLFATGSAHNAKQGEITRKENPTILCDDIVNSSDNSVSQHHYKYSDGIKDNNDEEYNSAAGLNGDTESLEDLQNSIPRDDGEWIDVNEDQIDPQAMSMNSDGVDNDIYVNIIWRPVNVEPDWNPYTKGYWENTDDGCSWVSNYSWGSTYHYGRWWYSDRWGWVWSPGRHRSNSWVCWRENNEYAGWYPISPRWLFNERTSCYEPTNGYVSNHWTFVPKTSLTNAVITNKLANDSNMNPKLFKKSKPVNNIHSVNDKIVNIGPTPTKNNNLAGVKTKNNNNDGIKKTKINNSTGTVENINKTKDPKINVTKTGINKTDITKNNSVKTKTASTTADKTDVNRTKNNTRANTTTIETPKVKNNGTKNSTPEKTKVNTTKVNEPYVNKQKNDNSTGVKTSTKKSGSDGNVKESYIPYKSETIKQKNNSVKTEQPKENYNTEVKNEKKSYNTEKQTTEKPFIKNEVKQNNTEKTDAVKEKKTVPFSKENKDNGKQ